MARRTALLQGQQLLGTEGLVVDLAGRLDKILQMGAGQEVAQVDELAVVLVLDVDDAPAVLTAADLLAPDDDGLFAAHNGEGDDVLDLGVDGALFVIEFLVGVGVHLQVVEREFLLDALFEGSTLLQGERVGLSDDGDNVDHVGKLLQHDNVNRLEGMARGLDEEEAAVNAGVLDIAFALGSQLLSQVRRVLVLDVFDNWVPARMGQQT